MYADWNDCMQGAAADGRLLSAGFCRAERSGNFALHTFNGKHVPQSFEVSCSLIPSRAGKSKLPWGCAA